jgi:hypothetical protein
MSGGKRALDSGSRGSGSEGVQTRVVCVPDFSKTGEAVLVDLNSPTLECTKMVFRGMQESAAVEAEVAPMEVSDK